MTERIVIDLPPLDPASLPMPPYYCPGCGRVMSNREHDEQGMCNDCNGGAYQP